MIRRKNIAKALWYARSNDAVSIHCRGVVKHDTPINGKMLKGQTKTTLINEFDIEDKLTHQISALD